MKEYIEDAQIGRIWNADCKGVGGRIGPGTLSERAFRNGYTLYYSTSKLRVPYVAFIDGFVIGGVCLS